MSFGIEIGLLAYYLYYKFRVVSAYEQRAREKEENRKRLALMEAKLKHE